MILAVALRYGLCISLWCKMSNSPFYEGLLEDLKRYTERIRPSLNVVHRWYWYEPRRTDVLDFPESLKRPCYICNGSGEVLNVVLSEVNDPDPFRTKPYEYVDCPVCNGVGEINNQSTDLDTVDNWLRTKCNQDTDTAKNETD